MTELITEVTEEGVQVPRALLEQCGYEAGRRVRVTAEVDGLLIRPAELTTDEIVNRTLRHLWRTTGEMAAIASVEECPTGWRAAVVLMPDRLPLGDLYFDLHGMLLAELSTPPERMIETANAA